MLWDVAIPWGYKFPCLGTQPPDGGRQVEVIEGYTGVRGRTCFDGTPQVKATGEASLRVVFMR